MQRYFISGQDYTIGQTVWLSATDSHHLGRVMRAKVGINVYVVDQARQLYLAQVKEITAATVGLTIAEVLESHAELPVELVIACGLSKHDKVEWIVQKATECGMSMFIPLALSRDVVKWEAKKSQQRVERLQKIAKEAAEQSHRLVVPEVLPLSKLNQLIQQTQHFDFKLVAYEETAKAGEHQALAHIFRTVRPNQRIVCVFGSEGGLTEGEVSQLEAAGFIRCSLGPRILRAETAPIYFLSAASYALELAKN